MPDLDPFESYEATAARLGITDDTPTAEQGVAFLRERDKITAARREATAAGFAPPLPEPDPADRLALARAQAKAIREQQAIRADLTTVLLEGDNPHALDSDELAGMSLKELRELAGIDRTPAQIEDDLANDYRANLEAASAEPDTFGGKAYRESLAAHIAERDSKPYSDGDG